MGNSVSLVFLLHVKQGWRINNQGEHIKIQSRNC